MDEDDEEEQLQFKVILLGDGAVGKTSYGGLDEIIHQIDRPPPKLPSTKMTPIAGKIALVGA